MEEKILKEFKHYVKEKYNSVSHTDYFSHLQRYIEFCHQYEYSILDGSGELFLKYKQWLVDIGLSKQNANLKLHTIRIFYKFLYMKGLVNKRATKESYSVLRLFEVIYVGERKEYYIRIGDLDKIIQKATIFFNLENPYHFKSVIYFMYYTGISVNEMIHLKRISIDLDYMKVTLTDRILFFTPKVRDVITQYFQSQPETINAFNLSREMVKRFNEILQKYSTRKKNITLAYLRDCFANMAIRKIGYNSLAYLLGTKSDEILKKYWWFDEKKIEKIYRRKIR
jgi:site-specific recombinase XerD